VRSPAGCLALLLCLPAWAATDGGSSPRAASAAEAMKRTVSEASISGPIVIALDKFRSLVGVRIEINVSALVDAGVKESDPVSVAAARATGEQLLDMLLARAAKQGKPLGWYAEGDTVHVTTQAEVFVARRSPAAGGPGRTATRPASGPSSQPFGPAGARQAGGRGPRSFQFDQTPAEEVFDRLRRAGDLNLFINWSSLELVGIQRDAPITLEANGVPLRQVLNMVTDSLSGNLDKMRRVYWVVDEGVVTVATGEALNNKLQTRVFDVADMLAVAPSFQVPDVSLTASSGQATGSQSGRNNASSGQDQDNQHEGDLPAQRQATKDTLMEVIRGAIGEDMWQPVGKGSIRLLGNKMVISQTPLGFKLLEEASRSR